MSDPEQPRLQVQTYQDKAGEHRWRLVARNGRIVGDSAEGYATRAGLYRALALLAEHAGAAFERGVVFPYDRKAAERAASGHGTAALSG